MQPVEKREKPRAPTSPSTGLSFVDTVMVLSDPLNAKFVDVE